MADIAADSGGAARLCFACALSWPYPVVHGASSAAESSCITREFQGLLDVSVVQPNGELFFL